MLARQPQIKDQLILALQENPTKGYRELSDDIGGWCSKNTIFIWLHGIDGFRSYTERIIPLLTHEQQEKQKLFAEHFVNHWGLPEEQKQKILVVNYDEKWFFGMVPRSHAKQCNAIGLF